MLLIFFLDVQMHSPQASLTIRPEGSSCAEGGIIRGKALGNTYNISDDFEVEQVMSHPLKVSIKIIDIYNYSIILFKVSIYVYTFHTEDPTVVKPTMAFTMNFTELLSSVLDELEEHFGCLNGIFKLF